MLNSDETPQPIDAPQKGRRPKVAKRKGKSVRKATSTSKENASVNMAWDLSGHLYGVQIILKLLRGGTLQGMRLMDASASHTNHTLTRQTTLLNHPRSHAISRPPPCPPGQI